MEISGVALNCGTPVSRLYSKVDYTFNVMYDHNNILQVLYKVMTMQASRS